jgi:hypothetical protein
MPNPSISMRTAVKRTAKGEFFNPRSDPSNYAYAP